MTATRTCAECKSPLPLGLPDLFCPACAFRLALAGGQSTSPPLRPVRSLNPATWFRRWRNRTQADGSRQFTVASVKNKPEESPAMTGVTPSPGDVIEDYEILEKIGGNMGQVFRARHRRINKIVALKLLPTVADAARLARFEREMRALGPLDHPNLVTAGDARSVDPWHLVAMEWIDGVDLHQLVRNHGPLPLAEACEAARQTAQALQYAHQNGLIHRDIKPSNLMLNRSGVVKVIDLGLALMKEDTVAQLTQTGNVLGTMNYCAPEQFRDASSVDIRADIYSLGCTLYHLLVGKSPYSQRKSGEELMYAHFHEPFPRLTKVRPDAPQELETVLLRMTAKEPNERLAAPEEVVRALEPFVQGADLKRLVPAKVQDPGGRILMTKGAPTPGRPRETAGNRRPVNGQWTRRAAFFAGIPAVISAVFILTKPSKRGSVLGGSAPYGSGPNLPLQSPTVVLLDTIAENGIYLEKTKKAGLTNAEELEDVLRNEPALRGLGLRIEKKHISIKWTEYDWHLEPSVVAQNPRLVVIHRSSFFHPFSARLGLTSPTTEEEWAEWRFMYRVCDIRLINFLGYVGRAVPHAKFIVYSRGTDPSWTEDKFRADWIQDIENGYPELKNRVLPYLIPNGKNGSFDDPQTVKGILELVKRQLAD